MTTMKDGKKKKEPQGKKRKQPKTSNLH